MKRAKSKKADASSDFYIKRKILAKSNKAIEMPFSWIFAILAGIVILLLAIYAANLIISSGGQKQSAETAKTITILIDPLETGIASAVGDIIRFNRETQTKFTCSTPDSVNFFGKQTISVSEDLIGDSGVFGPAIPVTNKFIFSNALEEGTELYAFSKPFYAGFKVADLTFLSSEKYCLIRPPEFIEEEMTGLSLANINVTTIIDSCDEDSIRVCFGGATYSGCDMTVFDTDDGEYKEGFISKDGSNMYYMGNLIYAGIFSDPQIYECNLMRLGIKARALANVYYNKLELVETKGCSSVTGPYLATIIVQDIESGQDFILLREVIEQMDIVNEEAACRLYPGEDY